MNYEIAYILGCLFGIFIFATVVGSAVAIILKVPTRIKIALKNLAQLESIVAATRDQSIKINSDNIKNQVEMNDQLKKMNQYINMLSNQVETIIQKFDIKENTIEKEKEYIERYVEELNNSKIELNFDEIEDETTLQNIDDTIDLDELQEAEQKNKEILEELLPPFIEPNQEINKNYIWNSDTQKFQVLEEIPIHDKNDINLINPKITKKVVEQYVDTKKNRNKILS